mgnify:FL=1
MRDPKLDDENQYGLDTTRKIASPKRKETTQGSVKPLDTKGIFEILQNHKEIIVIEEMVPHGGLSSRVKEIAFDNNIIGKLKCFTLKDQFIKYYGSYDQLLSKHGLSVESIYKKSSE